MDPSISSDELGQFKERTKINFFQVEKRLAEDDIRMDNIEKALGEIGSLKVQAGEGGKIVSAQIPDARISELSESVKSIKAEMGRIREDIKNIGAGKAVAASGSAPTENLKPQIARLSESLESLGAEVVQLRENVQKMKLTGVSPGAKGDPFSDIKGDVKKFLNQLPDLEDRFEDVQKDLSAIEAMRRELEEDRKLYMELRSAALASLEKFGAMEKYFSKSLEELGQLSRDVEETRRINEKIIEQAKRDIISFDQSSSTLKAQIRDEVRDEVTRLEAESSKIEHNVAASFEAMRKENHEYMNKASEAQAKRVAELTARVNDVASQFARIKSDVVEKTIDEEMNKLLMILSEKMKGLVTRNEFEGIKSEIRTRLEMVRSPELKPLEARIASLEEDISEMKSLVRGVSQRLPVIVE